MCDAILLSRCVTINLYSKINDVQLVQFYVLTVFVYLLIKQHQKSGESLLVLHIPDTFISGSPQLSSDQCKGTCKHIICSPQLSSDQCKGTCKHIVVLSCLVTSVKVLVT